MRFFAWLLRAFIFFTLFAFALNNLQPVTLQWFFGVQWTAPMVIVVLAAFAAGCAVGVIAMIPARWPRGGRTAAEGPASVPAMPAPAAQAPLPEHPPREGL